MKYYLTTGENKIRIGQREDGTKLDKLLLTMDMNYIPAGTGENLPPTANNDPVTTIEDTPVTLNVVGNDQDTDGTINPATVVIVSNPVNGTAVHNGDGTVTYSPGSGYTGVDTFTYTVKDNEGATSNEATVTVLTGAVGFYFPPPGEGLDKQIQLSPEEVGLDPAIISELQDKAISWTL